MNALATERDIAHRTGRVPAPTLAEPPLDTDRDEWPGPMRIARRTLPTEPVIGKNARGAVKPGHEDIRTTFSRVHAGQLPLAAPERPIDAHPGDEATAAMEATPTAAAMRRFDRAQRIAETVIAGFFIAVAIVAVTDWIGITHWLPGAAG